VKPVQRPQPPWTAGRAVAALLLILSSAAAARPSAQDLGQQCGHRHVVFDYTDHNQNENATYPSISYQQQKIYEKSFCDEIVNVETWFAQKNWWTLLSDEQPERFVALPETYLVRRGSFDGPYPDVLVVTNTDYQLSESLVPAFYGHRGRMQFPARRAAVNEGAIAHELTHVFFPNSNRMLAEGLAVYVQSKIGKNLAYPTFDQTPDQLVQAFTCGSKKTPLSAINLAALDQVTTPTPLGLRIGPLVYEADPSPPYAIAGSFVGYLIETDTLGIDLFHQLYVRTPLVPLERDAGSPERWREVYGVSLADLETGWKRKITNLGCPP
jgi:hypothetical protein